MWQSVTHSLTHSLMLKIMALKAKKRNIGRECHYSECIGVQTHPNFTDFLWSHRQGTNLGGRNLEPNTVAKYEICLPSITDWDVWSCQKCCPTYLECLWVELIGLFKPGFGRARLRGLILVICGALEVRSRMVSHNKLIFDCTLRTPHNTKRETILKSSVCGIFFILEFRVFQLYVSFFDFWSILGHHFHKKGLNVPDG